MGIDSADAAEMYFLWWRRQFEANGTPELAMTSFAQLARHHLGAAYDRDRESRMVFLKLDGNEFIASFDDIKDAMLHFSIFGSAIQESAIGGIRDSILGLIGADKGDYLRFFADCNPVVEKAGVSYESIGYHGVSAGAIITNPSLYLPKREDELFTGIRKYLLKPLRDAGRS